MGGAAPFSHPEALSAYLEAHGWKAVDFTSVGGTRALYSKVFERDPALPFPLSAQIMGSEKDAALQVGFGAYYSVDQRALVEQLVTDMVRTLFAASGQPDPSSKLAVAFATRDERPLLEGPMTLALVFPEAEPDQDFEHFSVGIGRKLATNEWPQWVADGLFDARNAAQGDLESRCRAILRRHHHALADAPLTIVTATDAYAMYTTPGGEMVGFDGHGDAPSVSVITPDGNVDVLE